MTQLPIISIIIATFNSAKTLDIVLESIRRQSYPQRQIEILIIDGGSTDNTLAIASRHNCKILPNPRTEPVYAKYLGFLNATGAFVVYLDHDEVIENPKSLELKHSIFEKHPEVKAVIGSGYKNPERYPFINNYINEFGDPFSYFIYRLSKDADFFSKQLTDEYKNVSDNDAFLIIDFSESRRLPIIELCAAGSMIDATFFRLRLHGILQPATIPHFYYFLLSESKLLGVTKNDALVHYSSDTLGKYLNKIRWRVKNNIYHTADMGASGFTGRNLFQPSYRSRLKKYLYIPYAFSVIFPLYDSIRLSITRKNFYYFIHVPLTLFTASCILYHYILKIFGYKPKLKNYDESKVIS